MKLVNPAMFISKASLLFTGVRRVHSFSPPWSAASASSRSRSNIRRFIPLQNKIIRPSSMSAPIAKYQSTTPLYSNHPKYTQDNNDAAVGQELEFTSIKSIEPLVKEAHETFATQLTKPYEFRMQQLRGIEQLIADNSNELSQAIAKDLGQSAMFSEAFELTHVISHSRHAQANLKEWMAVQQKPTPWPVNLNIPVHSELKANPRGVALIISPWNLPVQLNLNPLIDALAAGNICVLKMSERCVHTSSLLTMLLSSGRYVDKRAVRVINGAVDETTEILKQQFDCIMYTGGGTVGKIVAKAAAKHLTPTLLELGGKNPVIVTKNAHIPSAAFRIAWGKVTGNTGQMCICPDYVLVEDSIKEEFVNELCKAMDQMYPVSSYSNISVCSDHKDNTPDKGSTSNTGDVGKMISTEHAERVVNMLDDTCNIIYGGKHHNTQERFVAPTIVEATSKSKIMKDEIFGPILAIITIPNADGAIDYINTHYTSRGEHPLTLYIFSKSKHEQQHIMEAIPSGGCAINEVLKQSANYHVPFGGVGSSGMGAYYGKYGFDFFSHYRGTLVGNNYSTWKWDPSVWVAHPPFNDKKLMVFRLVSKVPLVLDKVKSVILNPVLIKFCLPLAFALACVTKPDFLDAVLELNLKTVIGWISQLIKR